MAIDRQGLERRVNLLRTIGSEGVLGYACGLEDACAELKSQAASRDTDARRTQERVRELEAALAEARQGTSSQWRADFLTASDIAFRMATRIRRLRALADVYRRQRDLRRFGEQRAWAIIDALGVTPTPANDHTAQVLAIVRRNNERYHEAMVELAKGPDPAEAAIIAAIEADGEAYDRAMAQLPDDSADPNHVCTPYGCCSGCGREVQTDG